MSIEAVDDQKYKELISGLQALSNYAGVRSWKIQAEQEIARLAGIARALDAEIAQQSLEYEKVKYEQSKKSFVGKLLGKGEDDKGLAAQLEKSQKQKLTVVTMARELQEYIDFTPGSPEEKAVLLDELRSRKREIQEKKREITQVMRNIRPAVKPQGPNPGTPEAASFERRRARYAAEAAVRLDETTKQALDRQSAQLEKDLQWVEKFNE